VFRSRYRRGGEDLPNPHGILRILYCQYPYPYVSGDHSDELGLRWAYALEAKGWVVLTPVQPRLARRLRLARRRYRLELTREGQEILAAGMVYDIPDAVMPLYRMAVILRQDVLRGFQSPERAASRFAAVSRVSLDRARWIFTAETAEDGQWSVIPDTVPTPLPRISEMYYVVMTMEADTLDETPGLY
jgi:hypothetical protein